MFLRSDTLLPVREEADPGHVPAPHGPEPHRGGHRRDEQEGGRAPAAVLLCRSGHDQTAAQAPGQRERPGELDAVPGNPQGSSCGPGEFQVVHTRSRGDPHPLPYLCGFSRSQTGGSPLATRASLSPSCLRGLEMGTAWLLRNLVNSDCLMEASRLKQDEVWRAIGFHMKLLFSGFYENCN